MPNFAVTAPDQLSQGLSSLANGLFPDPSRIGHAALYGAQARQADAATIQTQQQTSDAVAKATANAQLPDMIARASREPTTDNISAAAAMALKAGRTPAEITQAYLSANAAGPTGQGGGMGSALADRVAGLSGAQPYNTSSTYQTQDNAASLARQQVSSLPSLITAKQGVRAYDDTRTPYQSANGDIYYQTPGQTPLPNSMPLGSALDLKKAQISAEAPGITARQAVRSYDDTRTPYKNANGDVYYVNPGQTPLPNSVPLSTASELERAQLASEPQRITAEQNVRTYNEAWIPYTTKDGRTVYVQNGQRPPDDALPAPTAAEIERQRIASKPGGQTADLAAAAPTQYARPDPKASTGYSLVSLRADEPVPAGYIKFDPSNPAQTGIAIGLLGTSPDNAPAAQTPLSGIFQPGAPGAPGGETGATGGVPGQAPAAMGEPQLRPGYNPSPVFSTLANSAGASKTADKSEWADSPEAQKQIDQLVADYVKERPAGLMNRNFALSQEAKNAVLQRANQLAHGPGAQRTALYQRDTEALAAAWAEMAPKLERNETSVVNRMRPSTLDLPGTQARRDAETAAAATSETGDGSPRIVTPPPRGPAPAPAAAPAPAPAPVAAAPPTLSQLITGAPVGAAPGAAVPPPAAAAPQGPAPAQQGTAAPPAPPPAQRVPGNFYSIGGKIAQWGSNGMWIAPTQPAGR